MKDRESFQDKVVSNLKNIQSDELLLLKGHLFLEQALDNGIIIALGEKCLTELSLSFSRKLTLYQGIYSPHDPHIFQCVRSMNKIRNQLAHNVEYEIEKDLTDWIIALKYIKNESDISKSSNAYIRALRLSIAYIIGHFEGRNNAYNEIQ